MSKYDDTGTTTVTKTKKGWNAQCSFADLTVEITSKCTVLTNTCIAAIVDAVNQSKNEIEMGRRISIDCCSKKCSISSRGNHCWKITLD